MTNPESPENAAAGETIAVQLEDHTEELVVFLSGRLQANNAGAAWRRVTKGLRRRSPAKVIVDATELEYCDATGFGLLLDLCRRQHRAGNAFEIRGLREELQQIFDLFDLNDLEEPKAAGSRPLPERIGRSVFQQWQDLRALIEFVGMASVALIRILVKPGRLRWREAWIVAEAAGVNALSIVALISLLVGLIMAFQAAIPMRQFGAEIYVGSFVGLSMVRELGPLMTAIVLTGRSGSAFAAELGTMKVNEEIDALTTMGLDPMRFLVVPRIMAGLTMTPLLTVYADLLGVLGGSIVLISMGYPPITYFNQVLWMVSYMDLIGGLIKAVAFGVLIAGVGCLRGLQTTTGASAVGVSTTRAVVSGIILIVIVDGMFAVVYYYLGI
jgi:phospholipid/cholesterol/gamma-HCH transport system permease protein